MSQSRTIRVKALTRVEGEGGLHVRLRGTDVEELRLEIYEPPRLFESLLRGRRLEDAPDITARICGICPVAYQMSAVHALEMALGITVSPEVRRLRRLLYCGEWIESHALHVHLLHAPDFLGYESGLEMASKHREHVERGLRLKKHGNQLLEALGGRAIHPINVAVGGFYRLPRRDELQALIPDFEWGLQAAVETTRWVATFPFPDFQPAYEFVALTHGAEYPMNEGLIRTSSGRCFPASEFEQQFEEIQVPHSTALHCVNRETGETYFVGPLARVNLSRDLLSPTARRVADEVALPSPCSNPFQGIIARGVELIHAYEEALDILRSYHPARSPRTKYACHAGEGMAATEAPRGILYHRYAVDDRGLITAARITPPTSQNQAQIERDLRGFVPQVASGDDQRLSLACEQLVRSYDPCISCSTHFLKVHIERTP
jgi:coenzyme F420-reducing hydrogenase alpha subunit